MLYRIEDDIFTPIMNSDDVFLRAALYEECAKSSILKHVDVESSTIETLRELLNQNNMLVFRKFPIILSKLVVKHGLTFAKSKVPQLKFLTPENISVSVESDEMQYILNTQSSMKPNLIFMVSKNILISVVGSSISALKDDLLGREPESATRSFTKIQVKPTDPPSWPKMSSPAEYTNTFNDEVPSPQSVRKISNVSSTRSVKSNISKAKHQTPPKQLNYSTDKTRMILDNLINDLDEDAKITSNVLIRKADENFDEDISDFESGNEDDAEGIKISELQETNLKPNSVDFYTVAQIEPPVAEISKAPSNEKKTNDDDDDDNDCQIVSVEHFDIMDDDEEKDDDDDDDDNNIDDEEEEDDDII
ncbi:GrBNV gp67-like protein [Tomelloso virus]|uniref:GrBNV gp67-like protein n=1 Tax=Tomelloso virus TaxID=2053981 RepID=A0A2H4T2V9_9VIRU|nr:GrBNV gp67-like protein [Tomelloso virus]ATY70208.1 GrBNV gp67-like protein [Tomelloso virus]